MAKYLTPEFDDVINPVPRYKTIVRIQATPCGSSDRANAQLIDLGFITGEDGTCWKHVHALEGNTYGKSTGSIYVNRKVRYPSETFTIPSKGEGFQYAWKDFKDDLDVAADMQEQRHTVWAYLALTAPDQLRQRMAWALSQICVVGAEQVNDQNTEWVLQY